MAYILRAGALLVLAFGLGRLPGQDADPGKPAAPAAAAAEKPVPPADPAVPENQGEGEAKENQEAASEKKWSFSLSAYTYFVPDDLNYVQPTLTADRGALHLEARYNYEAQDTASAWAGYNFSGGERLEWDLTPMLGGVFGDLYGVAPGYRGSLSWWKLGLYSEGEYLIDTGDTSESFFYNWSELTLSPVEWFSFGLVTQRTRAYQADRDIQRGLLAEFSYQALSLRGIVFNLDEPKPLVVVAVGLSF